MTSSTKPVGKEARERTVEGAKCDGGVVWNSQGVTSSLDGCGGGRAGMAMGGGSGMLGSWGVRT